MISFFFFLLLCRHVVRCFYWIYTCIYILSPLPVLFVLWLRDGAQFSRVSRVRHPHRDPGKKKKKEIVCEKWRRRYLIFRGICFLWLVDKVVDWPGRCSLRTFKDFYFSLYLLATMPPSLVYPRWWEYLFVANLKRQGERERERERKVNWGQVYDEGHSPCR